jgi:hypothetical protein
MPFIVYHDVTGNQSLLDRQQEADTSEPPDQEGSGARTLPPILELPESQYQDEPRLEALPHTRGTDLTSLTGMSSEQRMTASSPAPDSEARVISREEADESDLEGLSSIWATHEISKPAIIAVLTERVHRHVQAEVKLNKELDPSLERYARMVRHMAIIEATWYARKQERRGTSSVSITSSISYHSYASKVEIEDKEGRQPLVESRPSSRTSQKESEVPPMEVPRQKTTTVITDSLTQEHGHPRPTGHIPGLMPLRHAGAIPSEHRVSEARVPLAFPRGRRPRHNMHKADPIHREHFDNPHVSATLPRTYEPGL